MLNVLNRVSEGGQTWSHRIRMLRQVVKTIIMFSFLLSVFLSIYKLSRENYDLIISTWYYLKASFITLLGNDKVTVQTSLWSQVGNHRFSGHEVTLSAKRVLTIVAPKASLLGEKTIQIGSFFLKVFIISNLSFFSYFLIRGSFSKRRKHVSGKRLIHPVLLSLWLKITRKASKIKIGNFPLLKGSETTHTLITGGTGSGKTNCLHHILKGIQSTKSKAIVIDTTGAFLERYYREGKDIILSPYDNRGVPWTPWAECTTKFDYDELAESFIPVSYHENENYWRTAAKSLFSSLLQKLEMTKRNSDLVKWALYEPLQNLCSFMEGTKSASHMDIKSEKTAGSVRSVASSFLECFEHLQDTEVPFSIKDWIQESDESWLFISCRPSERASITPLLSAWISSAVRGVINLEPSRDRRIWFVLDELPSLNKVKGLETLLTEGRKYGACTCIALQSPAQLESIYGREIAKIITGNCATKIVFAEYDAQTAEKISKVFGQKEVGECQEGISYGANDIRDGVNLSFQKKIESTVSSSEIQSLNPNQAFLKLPGKIPITKLKIGIAR